MIPSPRTNTRCIAEAALHFIGECDCRNQLRPSPLDAFRDSQCGGNIVARVRWFLRQISVVVIEVADGAAVGECRPVRRPLVIRPEDCGSWLRRKFQGDLARDCTRLFIPCTKRAT